MINVSTFDFHWHRVRLMLVALACAASVIAFLPAHAQGDDCFVTKATRSAPYTVPEGYTAAPGNGKSYPEGARVWGTKIEVCPLDTGEAGGEMPYEAIPQGPTSDWTITWREGATQQMKGHGDNAWPSFTALNPTQWPDFPNINNPRVGFPASHGLEFGEDESEFCGARGDGCEITVPAMHYRLITGDWSIPEIGKCTATDDIGCALAIVDVGLVTSNWADDVVLNNVYTISGRYWHGDFLPDAIVALLSHVTWNMTNGPSTLNPQGIVNAGANCSVPNACNGVRAVFAVTSGNELLILGETTWYR